MKPFDQNQSKFSGSYFSAFLHAVSSFILKLDLAIKNMYSYHCYCECSQLLFCFLTTVSFPMMLFGGGIRMNANQYILLWQVIIWRIFISFGGWTILNISGGMNTNRDFKIRYGEVLLRRQRMQPPQLRSRWHTATFNVTSTCWLVNLKKERIFFLICG